MTRKIILVSALFCAFIGSANAGSASGKVLRLYVHAQGGNGEGVAMFKVENRVSAPDDCGGFDGGTEWAISLEKEAGRAMYALLLSAESRGVPVKVYGFDDCDDWGDRERPKYIIRTDE